MKSFIAISALFASAFASPIVIQRAGPSGELLSPNSATSATSLSGVEINYTRVNGVQGYYTEYIDVDIIDNTSGKVTRLGRGLTSADKSQPITAWYAIPQPTGEIPVDLQVTYTVKVTEYQIGQNGPISFVAAEPTFNVRIIGGDQCAGRPNGDCGNTA